MAEGHPAALLEWISELTLAGLLAYILFSSQRKQWFWRHYVDELHERIAKLENDCTLRIAKAEKDAEAWKTMTLGLLTNTRKLMEAQPEVQTGRVPLPPP
jgi:hypothetical protein